MKGRWFPEGFPPPAAEPPRTASRMGPLAAAAALFVALVALYRPATEFRMLAFDDRYYAASPVVSGGLVPETVRRIFTTLPEEDLLIPVTQLSFMADVELYGGVRPRGFHLTNVVLFALSMAVLLLVLRSATGAFGRSAFAAALVALHPMRVESVAWVTERKDLLALLFLLLAVACHLRLARTGRVRWHLPLLLCAALSLLSKPMAVTLPALLLLLDFWPLGRFRAPEGGWSRRRALLLAAEKLPLLLLCALVAWVTVRLQAEAAIHWEVPLLSRVTHSLAAPLVYLYQTLWPADLAFRYFDSLWVPFEGTFLAVLLGISALTAAAARFAGSRPYLLFGLAWFAAALFPSSGIVPSGIYWIADRFTLLPHVGLAVAFAWGAAGLLPAPGEGRMPGGWGGRTLRLLPAVPLLALLAFLTRGQLSAWKDGATLFGKGLPFNRGDVRYEAQYVEELVHVGEYARAREALAPLLPRALDPAWGTPVQMGHLQLLERDEGTEAAVAQARAYLARDPNFWRTRLFLAERLLAGGSAAEAVPEFRRVLEVPSLSTVQRRRAARGLEAALSAGGDGSPPGEGGGTGGSLPAAREGG